MKADLVPLKGALTIIAGIFCVYLVYLNVSVREYQTETEVTKANANIMDVEEIALEQEEIIEEVEPIVYDGMTLEELSNQIDKSLTSTITGKGHLIASYSLEKGVDPYMATAIILHETGCKWGCSYLVRECNNVGGQKGSGCGSYGYFNSLDEGIMAFIDNLERNYISYGLTTPEEINPKYAEDPNWSANVNKYIEIIRAQ
ncbi:MAG: glucosaminidase domain-containing protein [Bacilli bacterium]|nr:glucosaminidase domain-containing protein [Bacilli bacterium]